MITDVGALCALLLLLQELECTQQRAAAMVTDVEARAAEALMTARMEHDATLARHLSFMVGPWEHCLESRKRLINPF
jgi:hypothetical protein